MKRNRLTKNPAPCYPGGVRIQGPFLCPGGGVFAFGMMRRAKGLRREGRLHQQWPGEYVGFY